MELKIKNKDLKDSIQFLENLSLKGKESRYRTKLINVLQIALNELIADELDLLKLHGLFKDGGLLPKELQDADSARAFNEEYEEVTNETVTIDTGLFTEQIKNMKGVLENLTIDLSGRQAEVYDILLDELEKLD